MWRDYYVTDTPSFQCKVRCQHHVRSPSTTVYRWKVNKLVRNYLAIRVSIFKSTKWQCTGYRRLLFQDRHLHFHSFYFSRFLFCMSVDISRLVSFCILVSIFRCRYLRFVQQLVGHLIPIYCFIFFISPLLILPFILSEKLHFGFRSKLFDIPLSCLIRYIHSHGNGRNLMEFHLHTF